MKFSIITAVKNNNAGLLRAIDCIRNQTYKNIEHIIIDGNSSDGTREILKQVQDDIHFAQNDSLLTTTYSLLSISEADSGIYDAINKGIRLASGDVIGLLHSDDLYSDENVIEKYAEIFNSDSGQVGMTGRVDAVYSDLVYVKFRQEVSSEKREVIKQELESDSKQPGKMNQSTTNYKTIRYWKTHKKVISNQSLEMSKDKNNDHYLPVSDQLLKNGWMPPHPTLFVRKEIFEKYGYYRTDMKISADYEMILRLLWKNKISAYYLPQAVYQMTIGGASNKNIKNILQKSKEDLRALKLHKLPHPMTTLLCKNFRKLPQFLARDLS